MGQYNNSDNVMPMWHFINGGLEQGRGARSHSANAAC